MLKVSHTLLTLPRYSGQWAPLPSDLSGTCLHRYIYIYISTVAYAPKTATVPDQCECLCRCMCRCIHSPKCVRNPCRWNEVGQLRVNFGTVFGTISGAFGYHFGTSGHNFGTTGHHFGITGHHFGPCGANVSILDDFWEIP